jgi:DNA-binding PadR family transcriptional regulator
MLDVIDIELLKYCGDNPCQPQAAAVKSVLGKRLAGRPVAERTLYDRLKALEAEQLIRVDRSQKNVSLVAVTSKGKDAITGREKPASEEARSP